MAKSTPDELNTTDAGRILGAVINHLDLVKMSYGGPEDEFLLGVYHGLNHAIDIVRRCQEAVHGR